MQYTIRSIGSISSPYRQKFGVSRQPGLVPAAQICITLDEDFHPDSVRGLDGFGYIWVHFIFHGVLGEGWSPLVRPPRLGGKHKMGVFATRSPHRPNHLGLSLLKLERVESGRPVRIWCSGADLMDGTPVIDIKPYIPFVEAKPDAASGFVSGEPERLEVVWQQPETAAALPQDLVKLIEQSIAQDPRPAYQDLPERVYVMAVGGHQVRFLIDGRQARVLTVDADNVAD